MPARPAWRSARALLRPLIAALAGAALIGLLSQLPARHRVDVGGFDAAYVQGFYDAEAAGSPATDGADGARWSRPAGSALLFPQAGLPGAISLRLRGWRPAGPPPRVTVLLNGAEVLDAFQASGGWEERSFTVRSGLLKASDFFIELRVEPALTLGDGRAVGVLVDAASYGPTGPPVTPYPAQLIYGALVGAMLWALFRQGAGGGRLRAGLLPPASCLLAYGVLWQLLYRTPPPLYPYPLRALPLGVCLGLAGLLALRYGPGQAARAPALVGVAAPAALIGLWTAATLLAARGHLTLARPGVENDFRVFATRESLGQIFSADGFYNLGYPLLLWLARPLAAGNAFLAGRLVAALSGAAMLGAAYWLARSLLPAGPALLALIALALSGVVAQYGLYVGSDMPFAACVGLCVAAFVAGRQQAGGGRRAALPLIAGVFGGLAFLMRHLGLVLLPWGVLVLLVTGRRGLRPAALFAAGFLLAAAPQIVINTAQAGSPLYNQQAKNIWLAVYGGTDWGRWDEAPNTVGLAEVVLRDPARFLGNWWRNMVGYVGSGAEDTGEFGRANQLRLLGWPANLLGAGALAWWLALGLKQVGSAPQTRLWFGVGGEAAAAKPQKSMREAEPAPYPLLLLVAIYVAAVSTAFTLQRFFLPLAPIYAVGAAWALWRLAGGGRALLGVALALGVVLWGGWAGGAGYALSLQPADEVAAAQMVEAALPAGATMGARVSARLPLAKYSAFAHHVVDWPAGADASRSPGADDLAGLRAMGASYLLWDEAAGPPPLAEPAAVRVASSGRYALYRLGP